MTTKSNRMDTIDTRAGAALACPHCAVELNQKQGRLYCSGCGKSWPVVNGVPHFIETFPYWGEMPQARMQEVNHQAGQGSWKAPLLESSDPDVRRAAEMILNLDRANWQWLIDLPAESRVLDLGAGTGTNSHALGMRFKEVVAVEPVLERIEFMRERFVQEHLPHVKPVRSSLWVLPFANQSFDMVAMNGVLEWVAQGQGGDPAEWQEKALANVFRLLRPGGYFYLGIENRYSLGYFAGYPDPHCGLPFVTVLPRPLAHWYARRRGQKDGYRNYLYSSRGYRQLLEKAGFSNIEIYVALPSYNHPRFLIPLDDGLFSYYLRNFTAPPRNRVKKALQKLFTGLRLLKHCEYSYVIVARK